MARQPRIWVVTRDEYNEYEPEIGTRTKVVCTAITISAAKQEAHRDAMRYFGSGTKRDTSVSLEWVDESNEKQPNFRTAYPRDREGVAWVLSRVDLF